MHIISLNVLKWHKFTILSIHYFTIAPSKIITSFSGKQPKRLQTKYNRAPAPAEAHVDRARYDMAVQCGAGGQPKFQIVPHPDVFKSAKLQASQRAWWFIWLRRLGLALIIGRRHLHCACHLGMSLLAAAETLLVLVELLVEVHLLIRLYMSLQFYSELESKCKQNLVKKS